jgi:crossover junction endodeoxyribonuclease RusA
MSNHTIKFTVDGIAQPKGNMRACKFGKVTKLYDANKNLPEWVDDVTHIVDIYKQKARWVDCPVEVHLVFWLPKPKSYPKTGRVWHLKKPDIDKVTRAILDCLSDKKVTVKRRGLKTRILKEGIIRDDSQIVSLSVWKEYADDPGVEVELININEFIKAKGHYHGKEKRSRRYDED